MGSTTAEPPRLLDLTRLTRRAGRIMTGIDRVEYAYLTHLLRRDAPLFGLVRSSLGYILLDRQGCQAFAKAWETGEFGLPGLLAQLKPGLDPARAGAESLLRRTALARCLPPGLARMLKRHLPSGCHYLNTGHSNLTPRVLRALRCLPDMRIGVLVHDTIPLDFPQFQRPGMADRFAGFLTRCAQADLLIANSAATAQDLQRHLGNDCPQIVTAHLGIDTPQPGKAPDGPWHGAPYFLCLGTIEPRKNHALLLDLWPEIPKAHLLICGQRGWNNDAVFAQLDRTPDRVHELNTLSDPELFALLQQSSGLLFPSFSEGYGLPPIEAAALNVPILCNDLPIYREILSDIPIYAEVSDRYQWSTMIKRLAETGQTGQFAPQGREITWTPPNWDAHFKAVLTLI
ncbi:MAG: glycosyltransferase family 4 protein [Pelagimonas sp.]|jgi:glycosyltransferase involved in cell wall biosynthesis|nr:glycosyltransferase family 4 protein [Pelagimonas sp.]